MKKVSLVDLLQAGFAALVLMATAWLLWPWQGGNAPAAYFLPTVTFTPSRVIIYRTPTPTSYVPTATPQPVVHVVQPQDVLGTIARLYGVSVEAITEANELKDANFVRDGQKLIIPGAVRTATPEVTDTPVPSATPTSRFPYAAPVLLGPDDGAVFHGSDAGIRLTWTSVAILKEGEWYEISVWSQEQDLAHATRLWTQASSLILPASLQLAEGNGLLHWTVSVVYRGRGRIALSPAGDVSGLYWY